MEGYNDDIGNEDNGKDDCDDNDDVDINLIALTFKMPDRFISQLIYKQSYTPAFTEKTNEYIHVRIQASKFMWKYLHQNNDDTF